MAKNVEDGMQEGLRKNIRSMIMARYPFIWVQTPEEHRTMKIIEEIAGDVNREAFVWDNVQLWQPIQAWTHSDLNADFPELPSVFTARNLTQALKTDIDNVIQAEKRYLLVFPDFHFYIQDTMSDLCQNIIRILKWLNPKIRASGSSVVFLSNSNVKTNEIKEIIHIEIVKPPNKAEIESVLNRVILNVPIKVDIPMEVRELMISSALGLTLDQAERLFSLAISLNHESPSKMVDVIVKGKKGIIASSGALEFFAPNEVPDYLAGLEVLKEWLTIRRDAFTPDAEKYGLPKPRGVFLMGIPGTGKSLTAKYIAGKWKMPLLRFDIGALFGSLVGQTEESMRNALHLVEAIAPAVLWIDEIEKTISTGPDLDAGVSKRVLGTLLTWMQENRSPVFVIATANDTSHLPPELMRKGRFDEIFFLDLPHYEERFEIFRVHLKNVKRDPEDFSLEQFAEETQGFVGAEIEQVIKEALYLAYSEKHRPLTNKDIFTAIRKTKPLSKTKETMIHDLCEMVERQEVISASKAATHKKIIKKHQIELDTTNIPKN